MVAICHTHLLLPCRHFLFSSRSWCCFCSASSPHVRPCLSGIVVGVHVVFRGCAAGQGYQVLLSSCCSIIIMSPLLAWRLLVISSACSSSFTLSIPCELYQRIMACLKGTAAELGLCLQDLVCYLCCETHPLLILQACSTKVEPCSTGCVGGNLSYLFIGVLPDHWRHVLHLPILPRSNSELLGSHNGACRLSIACVLVAY